MKTLKDLTHDDVEAIANADGWGVTLLSFRFDGLGRLNGVVKGRKGEYKFKLQQLYDGQIYINEKEAPITLYAEMKRRGFAVPVLDEVYGNLHEQINTLEGALAYSDGVFKTMVENEGKRIEEQLQQRDERITELEYELETANEEIADLVHQIDEMIGKGK